MTEQIRDRLIDLFWAGLQGWTYDSWESASSSEKEDIVTAAIVELGDFAAADIDEVYDLFWEWADGLDRTAFNEIDEEV